MDNCKFCDSREIENNSPVTHWICGTTAYDDQGIIQGPLCMVLEERRRQDLKWGEQNHDGVTWTVILAEEVGEYAQAALETQFGGKNGGHENMLTEAIHCAAVGLAIVECLVRAARKEGL